jgi:UDP-glucuronate 4-epimerase
MRILITGCAGFIGFHLSRYLLQMPDLQIVGIDNLNSYYDTQLKENRLKLLLSEKNHQSFQFLKIDISDNAALEEVYNKFPFQLIIHLAAQAGVRYSLENPEQYINSNINGFYNILELCRNKKINKLFFASSSSVYGNNPLVPYHEDLKTDSPISLYAATKKSNEAMAFAYHHLFGISTIGLRFFTVYGPWGRPDMAYFNFTEAIYNDLPIKVFNNGDLKRDFTYIDDVVVGIYKLFKYYTGEKENESIFEIFNIGHSEPVVLSDFIAILENLLQKKAIKEFKSLQPGDVNITYADVTKLFNVTGYKPSTDIQAGLAKFIDWYINVYRNEGIG